jgi:hypothetical protein
VGLADNWDRISRSLPEGWHDLELRLLVREPGQRSRAAALLGPLTPGRVGEELRFVVSRGSGVGPQAARRLLANLDEERIQGRLMLSGHVTREVVEEPAPEPLAAQWDEMRGGLPEDWSDLLCRLTLASSDDTPQAALLCAPLNPSRPAHEVGFEFRAARTTGYGASAQMVRRCLARLDDAGVPGTLELLRALSDTHHAATQGPVWYVGGKVL